MLTLYGYCVYHGGGETGNLVPFRNFDLSKQIRPSVSKTGRTCFLSGYHDLSDEIADKYF
jgi:hypothetical protein